MKKKRKITKKNIYMIISLVFIALSVISLFWGIFDWDANIYFMQNINGKPSETSHHFTETVYYYNIIFPIKNDGIIMDLTKNGLKFGSITNPNPLWKQYASYMYFVPILVLGLTMLPVMAEYEKKPTFKKIKYLVAAFLIILSSVLIFISTRSAETFLKGVLDAADPDYLIHSNKSTITVTRYIYPDLTLLMMAVISYFMVDLALTKKSN